MWRPVFPMEPVFPLCSSLIYDRLQHRPRAHLERGPNRPSYLKTLTFTQVLRDGMILKQTLWNITGPQYILSWLCLCSEDTVLSSIDGKSNKASLICMMSSKYCDTEGSDTIQVSLWSPIAHYKSTQGAAEFGTSQATFLTYSLCLGNKLKFMHYSFIYN